MKVSFVGFTPEELANLNNLNLLRQLEGVVIEIPRVIFPLKTDIVILNSKAPQCVPFCKLTREAGNYVPILVLMGEENKKKNEDKRIRLLEAGADSCVDKSIDPDELESRIHALMRRAKWPAAETLYCDSRLRVDFTSWEVWVNNKVKNLTPIPFKILCYLLRQKGKECTIQEIMHEVWGPEYCQFNLVKWHITHLREALGAESIVSVRGTGYKYEPTCPTPS